MGFAPRVGAAGCSGSASPGAIALQAEILEAWGPAGLTTLGIYNCRRIAGTSVWSVHAEGRALDVGVTGAEAAAVSACLRVLLECGDQVLQQIIYDGRIYDQESPLGRDFQGDNQHVDHLHIELSWAAARGELPLELQLDDSESEDEMVGLLVAYKGAQFVVRPDLTGKRGLSETEDVRALSMAGYISVELTERLMGSIPNI